MKLKILIAVSIIIATLANCQNVINKPVTPNPSHEAVTLLNYIYSISGEKTLTGQHDQPLFGIAYFQRVYEITKEYPALHGFDFGFSEPNTLDGINFRQTMVDDAIRLYKDGTIITFMWHAAPPTHDEPVTFKGEVQSKMNDALWHELITPGTPLNVHWLSQVDVIAFFLKQLRNAHVPVIWRPYHEMNGNWFWWSGRTDENGYKRLYTMLFDRLVNYHKINNLLWVFNANETNSNTVAYDEVFPGLEYVDILATDVYRNNFQQNDYDQLLELGKGKPIALGEVGKLPTSEILKKQTKYTWFMCWADHVFKFNSIEEIEAIYNADNTLTRDEVEMNK